MKKYILLFFLFCCVACGPNLIYDKSYSLPDEGWTYANSLQFDIAIKDTLAIYNLSLELKHSVEYSYQNLYTSVKTTFPSGVSITEPLSLELQNSIGQWQGNCGNASCTISIPIQEGAYFNAMGKHRILISQFMRKDSLAGIEQIRLTLEDTGEKRGITQ